MQAVGIEANNFKERIKLMWPYPKIVAHRGAGVLAPENTLAALRCAVEYGFYAIECDVMLSSDGVPILMHDEILGRTVAGIGKVADLTVDALTALDAGSWLDSQFAHARICTYQQALHFCQQHQIWMNVEIKPTEGLEVETGHIVAQVTKYFFSNQIAAQDKLVGDASPGLPLPLFSSFSFEALRAAQMIAPTIPRGLLMDEIVDDWVDRLVALKAVALHTNHLSLSDSVVQEIKKMEYGLFCYTVNTPARARQLFDWGVDGICTDRLDLIGPDFF